MATKIFALYLGMLLVTEWLKTNDLQVVCGRIVPLASRRASEFGNQNSTRPNGGGGFGSFAQVPQQFMQVAQQAAGQGLAAGQQAAGIFSSIMNAFLAAAMNAANNFSNFFPNSNGGGSNPQQGRSAFAEPPAPYPFPFPFPLPLQPGPQALGPAPGPWQPEQE